MRRLIALCLLLLAVAGQAFAAPRVLYATFGPNPVTGGSFPSIRVTLSENVATDTVVTLGSDSPFLNVPASVTVFAGQRYGTVNTVAFPVDSDTFVHATATLGSSTASGGLTILAPRLLTCYFTLGEFTISTLGQNQVYRFNVVLTGPAGPSGFWIDMFADGPLSSVLPIGFSIPAGERYGRRIFRTNGAFGGGSAGAIDNFGVSIKTSYNVLAP